MASDQPSPSDKERLTRIEVEIGHLKGDIGEVYRYLREEFSKMVSLQIEDLRRRQEESEINIKAKAPCASVADLETRMRSLEKWIWKAIGALAILSVLAPYILSKLGLVSGK